MTGRHKDFRIRRQGAGRVRPDRRINATRIAGLDGKLHGRYSEENQNQSTRGDTSHITGKIARNFTARALGNGHSLWLSLGQAVRNQKATYLIQNNKLVHASACSNLGLGTRARADDPVSPDLCHLGSPLAGSTTDAVDEHPFTRLHKARVR